MPQYRVMSAEDAAKLVEKLDSIGWKEGKGRSQKATQALKNNLEIIDKNLSNYITQQLMGHPELSLDAMIKKVFPPKFNNYTNGGEYKRHTDVAFMGGEVRTDLACTIFLNSPDSYEGGELVVEGLGIRHKGQAGTCIVYPCSEPHYVTPVTSGSRVCAITWFESLYRDSEKRNLMAKFLKALNSMEDKHGDLHTTLASIHGKLQRMWIEN